MISTHSEAFPVRGWGLSSDIGINRLHHVMRFPPDCSLTWGLRNLNASMLVDHGTVCVTFMMMIQPDGLA